MASAGNGAGVLSLLIEALRGSLNSKPVRFISVIVTCVLLLLVLIWTSVAAYIDLRDRLYTSETNLEELRADIEQKARRIDAVTQKVEQVEVVKAATEDASLIQRARVTAVEAEIAALRSQQDLVAKEQDGGATPVDELVTAAKTFEAAAFRAAVPKPRTAAVLDDGVIQYPLSELASDDEMPDVPAD